MKRLAGHVMAGLGTICVACTALALDPPKTTATSQVQARRILTLDELRLLKVHPERRLMIRQRPPGLSPTGVYRYPAAHLVPRWNQGPTYGGEGNLCGTLPRDGWIFDWGVANTGAKSSEPGQQLVLTCELAGGMAWPPGQQQYLEEHICGCMRRTFYVPAVPAGATVGFGNPNGFRMRSFQNIDYVPCNDPSYPHAKVTAKVGPESATIELCQ